MGANAGQQRPVTVAVRVAPASSRTAVGGTRGEALIVRVTEAAVDGRATEAALVAIARALGVPRRSVSVRSGTTSRDKVIVIEDPPAVVDRLALLRGGDRAQHTADG